MVKVSALGHTTKNKMTMNRRNWQQILSVLLLLLLYNMYVSCHRHFFLVLLLNQRWSPPLRLQASHCSTFHIMYDVPSIAVFCSESIECFPGTAASKFFPKLLVTIPVAPIITGTIVHFRFYIRCISIHRLLYFNFFSTSFCTTFLSAGIATSISVHVFSFLFLIIIIIIIIIIITELKYIVPREKSPPPFTFWFCVSGWVILFPWERVIVLVLKCNCSCTDVLLYMYWRVIERLLTCNCKCTDVLYCNLVTCYCTRTDVLLYVYWRVVL